MKPDYWDEAKTYLSGKDEVMAKIIATYPEPETLRRTSDSFTALVRSIVGQQLSVKAADKIWQRTVECLGEVKPSALDKASDDELRACGLSWQKIKYIRNIAAFFQSRKITEKYWQSRSYEDTFKELLEIKGVGPWTIEMFGIFYLMEPDIFPISDLGVLKAVNLSYFNQDSYDVPKIKSLSLSWAPFRTVATWYLWRTLDPYPVQY